MWVLRRLRTSAGAPPSPFGQQPPSQALSQSPFVSRPGAAPPARGPPQGQPYRLLSSTPFGPGVPIDARPPKTQKNIKRADRRRTAPKEENDSLDDAAKTANAELREQLGEVEAKLEACAVLGVASCPQHQQLLSDQLRLLREVEASRSPGARLREARRALDAAVVKETEMRSEVTHIQTRLNELAKEVKDTEDSHKRAELEATQCQPAYDTHLAAMPQVDRKAGSPVNSQPAAPFDATVQLAFLLENGADDAMSLVSRAVAAATCTPTSAALDDATQERVQEAIRQHLRHAGLIPPVDATDPSATPTPQYPSSPTPGGSQPQEVTKKKEGAADDKSAANLKAGKKGPLGIATGKAGEGNSKRLGKLSKRHSDTADENMHGTDDGAEEH